jgi:peptidyl-prolyl cis-trans isomerase C
VIARTFGEDFAAGLADQPDGAWSGPLASVYGLHLVRIVAREAAVDPPLAEVEPRVLREWQRQQRDAYAAEEYRRLRDSYEVVLPFAEGAGAPQR